MLSETAQDPQFNAVELLQIKQSLSDSLTRAYRTFVNNIHTLPVSADMKARALIHLDDGMLWIYEAIRIAEFKPTPVPVSEPVPESSPLVDETVASESDINKIAEKAINKAIKKKSKVVSFKKKK